MPGGNPFFPHNSDNLREEVAHIKTFLARAFAVRQSRASDPRFAMQTRASGPTPAIGSGAASGSSVLGGDVTGPVPANQVASLQNVTLTITSPSTGQVIAYNGTALVNTGTVGALTLQGDLTLSTHNLVTDGTTGTKIGTVGGAAGQKLSFFGAATVTQPLLATGAGHTVDDVISALQTLGLLRQL